MTGTRKTFLQQIVIKDLAQFSQVYLIPLADWHIGDRNAAVDVIQGYIDWIKERDNAFTILNGDLLNAATKLSKSELYDDLTTPDKSYARVLEMLLPIKDKILMITRGNHEENIYKQVGADYMARLSFDLGNIPYKPDGGMLGLRLKSASTIAMCYAYAVHGWGGARTIGAKVKKAQDLMQVAEAHIYILSHDHTQNINRGNALTPSKQHVRPGTPQYLQVKRQLFVNTGGFIRYGGYIQRKGYTPQDLGTPRIRIELKHSREEGHHMDLHASI